MKILLAQNAHYYPALGGANRSNRTLIEELKTLGNECRVVATTPKDPLPEEVLDPVHPVLIKEDVAVYEYNGITVHAVKTRATIDTNSLKNHLLLQIEDFNPDFILISTEDVGQVLLEAAVQKASKKVIYLARTTLYLPVGPECFLPIPSKTEYLKKVGGIISVGDYVKEYLKKYADVESVVLPISVFGKGPFPYYCNYKDGYILMVNPCAYKGITIFLELADQFPNEKFAAIPTWGTTSDDMNQLRKRENITIFQPFENMDDIFCRTKIIVVPSLWAEAKSRTIIEGMLRGIPVVASDVGGNREAKLGVDYTLPIQPIRQYSEICDEKSLPKTLVEIQNMEPWFAAVSKLTTDYDHYKEISKASREAAVQYVKNRGGCEKVHEYLKQLLQKSDRSVQMETVENYQNEKLLDSLSEQRKALLLLRLNQIKMKDGGEKNIAGGKK